MSAEVDAMDQARSQTASGLREAGLGRLGFERGWFALTVAFALHVYDEAASGFLNVYNPTVVAMRARWGWFPMPTFSFREWFMGLIAGVVLCLLFTPYAARGVRWLRPLAWFYALIMFFNGVGHTVATFLGHTVASVTFPRPAPGFYSSPLLLGASAWLMLELVRTAPGSQRPASGI